MRKITRPKKAIHALKREEFGWQTARLPETMAKICRALDDPIRATIFDLLDKEPIRQIELTRLVNEATGRKLDVASIMHHLGILKRAGLVAYREFRGGKTKVKMVYRTADVEIRTRKRPEPEIVSPPRIASVDAWLLDFRKKRSAET